MSDSRIAGSTRATVAAYAGWSTPAASPAPFFSACTMEDSSSKRRKCTEEVFSEFSRRFGVNGSMGTDHGHGGVAYLAGKPVVGGFYGPYPAVAQATQPYYNWYPPFRAGVSTDFRSIDATNMENLFGVPSAPVLGQQFPLLGCL